MSHRVVDDFVVAKFDAAALRTEVDHHDFYDDQYMFFELGGDNNLTQRDARSGREVRCRSWNLLAIGQKWEVMQRIVTFSSACEGGSMRFNGERHTLPEGYIRKARLAIGAAFPPKAIYTAGLSCSVTIKPEVDVEKTSKFQLDRVAKLHTFMEPDLGAKVPSWSLYPLNNLKHAAIVFAFSHLDSREVYNQAEVSGHEYAGVPFAKRAKLYEAPLEH